MIFYVLILISTLAVIGAISAILAENKRKKRAKKKMDDFEREHPPTPF